MKSIAGEMNPVIWQALAPHLRHLRHTRHVPVLPKLRQHHLSVGDVELDCRFEFEPGEPRQWDEPGWPDQYNLIYAYVKGVDISGLLSDSIVDELEERAALK